MALFLLAAGAAPAATGSATADIETRDYTLTVASAHGSPAPTVGPHADHCWRSAVTCCRAHC